MAWSFVEICFLGRFTRFSLDIRTIFRNLIKLPKNYFVKTIQILLTFHFVAFCWLFFRAKDFSTALQLISNIGELTFDWKQWLVITQGYQNVFLLILIGFVWHFLPNQVIQFLQKAFGSLPLIGKAIVLAFVFWIVYATASAGPQPFIYFQF
jgi:hypothetical protein